MRHIRLAVSILLLIYEYLLSVYILSTSFLAYMPQPGGQGAGGGPYLPYPSAGGPGGGNFPPYPTGGANFPPYPPAGGPAGNTAGYPPYMNYPQPGGYPGNSGYVSVCVIYNWMNI